MNLGFLAVLSIAALIAGLHPTGRRWWLLIASLLAVYALQPATPIRGMDYWLPTITIALTILSWLITRQSNEKFQKEDLFTLIVISSAALLIGLNRYIEPFCCITPTRPPVWTQVVSVLAIIGVVIIIISHLPTGRSGFLVVYILTLLGLFIILKLPPLAQVASGTLRSISGQQAALANATDIRWLGFSYVAFRLIHTLRDRMAGRMAGVTLQELLIYTIFFPAISAGPIDRLPRFTQELRKPFRLSWEAFWVGGQRFLWGVFKKFVLADSLALVALNDQNAAQVTNAGWLWVILYIYALRIFFDFSGYTDIAIGLGNWMGFKLPENFDRPYLKSNLTQFWNSWHITLAQWFRAYFFNPFTRWLRARPVTIPIWGIILFAQISTMLLIGLWHGITWNFFFWGLWHGVGLFLHNRWHEFVQPRLDSISNKSWVARIQAGAGMLLTFQYVTLGWVWFALSTPALSWDILMRLTRIR